MTTLRFDEQWRDDVPVVRLEGEIDSSNTSDIAARLRALLTNRSHVLVVDLAETTYLDSAGINLLFMLGDEMRRRQQVLRLVVAQPSPIARMIALTGLDRAVPTHRNVEDALSGDAASG